MLNDANHIYDRSSDLELHNERNLGLDMSVVSLLQSVLYQAMHDAIKLKKSNPYKIEATQWLCDEDNRMLQLCLQCVNIDYYKIIRKVAKDGWNLSL